jgi:hypothetical protein
MIQTGFEYAEQFGLHESFLPLAQAIWRLAQEEEREKCAKICEEPDQYGDEPSALYLADEIRNRNKAIND